MAANPIRQKGLVEETLLARYKENCDQARQHDAMVCDAETEADLKAIAAAIAAMPHADRGRRHA